MTPFRSIMNKKLLVLSAIAAGLLLTACVKKESPSENEKEETQAVSEPAEFHPLEATTSEEVTIPPHVEVERTEIQTTTEVNTTEVKPQSNNDAPIAQAAPATAPQKATTVAVEEKSAAVVQQSTPKTNTNSHSNAQSEDDAVAAAIAAATPALKN